MEAKTNYAIVGFIVLILVTSFIFSSVWLSVGFNKGDYDIYAIYMHEAVSGLSLDAPVKFNGVKVGFVKDIQLNPRNPQQVLLLVGISHQTPITASTTATLISQGITGTTYVGLSASSPILTPITKNPRDPYPIIPAKPSLFNQLDNALKGVSENINTVATEVERVFDKENAENIKATLKNLRIFTDALATEHLSMHEIMQNIENSTKELPQTIESVHRGATLFTSTTLPYANRLLRHLDQMAINLQETSRNLKENPSVMVRGTKPEKPGPGE